MVNRFKKKINDLSHIKKPAKVLSNEGFKYKKRFLDCELKKVKFYKKKCTRI